MPATARGQRLGHRQKLLFQHAQNRAAAARRRGGLRRRHQRRHRHRMPVGPPPVHGGLADAGTLCHRLHRQRRGAGLVEQGARGAQDRLADLQIARAAAAARPRGRRIGLDGLVHL
jgi:hypothetical protein